MKELVGIMVLCLAFWGCNSSEKTQQADSNGTDGPAQMLKDTWDAAITGDRQTVRFNVIGPDRHVDGLVAACRASRAMGNLLLAVGQRFGLEGFVSTGLAGDMSAEEFRAYVSAMKDTDVDPHDLEVSVVQVGENRATCLVGAAKGDVRFVHLVKDEGRWKVGVLELLSLVNPKQEENGAELPMEQQVAVANRIAEKIDAVTAMVDQPDMTAERVREELTRVIIETFP